ncbi:MAG: hypothetical protein J6N20_03840 [Pseudomonas sp.]|nr:hypothetical protein [Pseudomonas sp.]
MANSKTHGNVNLALAALAAQGPDIKVQRVTPIGNKFARVLATISATASVAQTQVAAKRDLHHLLTPVPNTFAALASNGVTKTIEFVVGVLEERVVLDQSNATRFAAVASTNMYIDSEEKLWSANKTDAGVVLIKSHAGDDMEIMSALMKCVASTAVGQQESLPAADAQVRDRNKIEGGDLVTFVSESTGRVDMGFVVAALAGEDGSDRGLFITNQDGSFQGAVDRNLVIATVAGSQLQIEETTDDLVAVASGRPSLEMMLDYYRKVFIRSPEYFAKFRQRLLSHAFA